MSTLARWAFAGGWRDKDIAEEKAAERLASLRERLDAQRALERAAPHAGRPEYARPEYARMEYKGLPGDACGFDAGGPPPPDPALDRQYPSGDPDYGPGVPDKTLPKFLTRGGDPDEQVCWAAPQLWARTPPWAPGNVYEEPEFASLFLAEDLMRQGLLGEAEKALRFTKNWLQVSRMVFDKEEREDAARREYHEREVREREREKARCKALGLPDPDEELAAWVEQFRAEAKASGPGRGSGGRGGSGGSSGSNAANPSASASDSLVTAPG